MILTQTVMSLFMGLTSHLWGQPTYMAEEESGCLWMALQWPRTRNGGPVDGEEGLPCALFSDSQILGKSCQAFGPVFPQLM